MEVEPLSTRAIVRTAVITGRTLASSEGVWLMHTTDEGGDWVAGDKAEGLQQRL